jgi:hypothetical protein
MAGSLLSTIRRCSSHTTASVTNSVPDADARIHSSAS